MIDVAPDIAVMREHLEHLFGGVYPQAHFGEIELAWTDASGALRHALRFTTDQLDEMADAAAKLNATPMCNVYVGAALRRPHFPGDGPVGRASDADFLALTCAYADLDEPGATAAAKDKYGTVKPTKIVVTGRAPAPRAQLWWRLDEPIQNPIESVALLKGIAAALGGDPTVVNPSRVMRLAGSIAWPMKPDRVIEMTHFGFLKQPGQPEYAATHMRRVFHLTEEPQFHVNGNGPLNGPINGPQLNGPSAPPQMGEFPRNKDAFGHDAEVTDRRELYMRNTIEAVLIELIGAGGRVPGPDELFAAAWPQFERGADLSRPGHNSQEEFGKKCIATVRRFHEGRIAGCESVEVAQAIWQGKQKAREGFAGFDAGKYTDFNEFYAKQTPSRLYPCLTVEQILDMPDPVWMIDDLINERALGFIYGPPSSLKTFTALDIALSTAARLPQWWGRNINSPGTVVYLCREGTRSLKFRILAWELHRKAKARGQPFILIEKTINFMKPEDIRTLAATVANIKEEIGGPIAAVFVDTVSRVLPGAKENQQEDMTLFVEACEYIQERFQCVVVGVHHTNRNGEWRGSSVIPGAGDFLLQMKRELGEMFGFMTLMKIKDGEDGKVIRFTVTKVEVGTPLKPRTSLMVDPVAEQESGGYQPRKEGLESALVRKDILDAMQKDWDRGVPWGPRPQSTYPAVRMIMSKWSGTREEVNKMIDRWVLEGVIEVAPRDAKRHVSGYRIKNNTRANSGE